MRTTIAAFAATFSVVTAGPALSQDPVKLSPQMYTVLLDNEHVRVLEFRCKPGEKEPLHSHPGSVAYSLTASKFRATTRDGETTERETEPGTADWVEPVTHSFECLGPAEQRTIITELKGHARPAAEGTMRVSRDTISGKGPSGAIPRPRRHSARGRSARGRPW
jgi:quercetin dioxygenase-like cupin family protein